MRPAPLAGAVLALALLVAPAHAQPPPAAPAAPQAVADVPSGPGRIVGRVVHPQDPTRAGGVEVLLYAITAGGQPGVRHGRTDADGSFRFEGVATSADVAYLVGARYDGVPFVGPRIAFAPGETEHALTLSVAERTRDARDVTVEETTLRIDWIGPELAVAQSFRLRNAGDRVVYLEDAERTAAAAPFRALLPEGVARFEWPYAMEPEGLERAGREVRFFGPIYPGEQEIGFLYSLPAQEGRQRLRVELPSGAAKLTLLYPASGLELTAPGFAAAEPVEISGRSWRALTATDLRRGARLDLDALVPAPSQDTAALSLAQVRSFLELDDTALHVSEEYELAVAGGSPLVAAPGQALLRIPLPEGASDLRFGADGFGGGLGFEAGALVVRGPLPPGSSHLELRYRLPPGEAGAAPVFARRFERPLPLFSVFVADTGLVLQSDRLHRRRPVRTQDARIYLHFEAFHVQPDEEVRLALAPVPPRLGMSRAARGAFVAALALGIGLFLTEPLRRQRAPAAAAEREPDAAHRERAALYAAIHDLDHDHETGKLADADWREMRDRLRARAVELMQASEASAQRGEAERSPVDRRPSWAASSPEPAPSPAPTLSRFAREPAPCPACNAPTAPGARFCAQCGKPLAGAGAPG
jgi:hypothetical protein